MVRDLERRSAQRGLAFAMPEGFPANALHAARLAVLGKAEGWCAAFSRAVFHAEFADGKDIGDVAVLLELLSGLGIDAQRALAASREAHVKEALRAQTILAQDRGIFGAPSFVTSDRELFWGDDRLEDAIAWEAVVPSRAG